MIKPKTSADETKDQLLLFSPFPGGGRGHYPCQAPSPQQMLRQVCYTL